MLQQIASFVSKYKLIIFVSLVSLLGLYLRFYRIEETFTFTWDQGRDAWAVREILHGKFPLEGPRTGVGNFYLGPAYFYLLAPFYFLFKMDPMATNYFNMAVNAVTLPTLFLVAKKVFNPKVAIISLLIFALTHHAISSTRTPWNITLIPLLSTLIIFSIYQILKGKHHFAVLTALLCGFFFHAHFSAIFLPFIIAPTILFVKNKKALLKWSLISLPLFIIWFIPTVVDSFTSYHKNFYLFRNFLLDYAMGFHFRFMFFRLEDAFIQIASILFFKQLDFLKFLTLPLFLAIILLFEKDRYIKKLGLLISLWFVIPLIGFTFFKGHVTDYYYLINLPIAVFIISYILAKLLNLKKILITSLIVVLLAFYFWSNAKLHFSKPTTGGLAAQKEIVRLKIKNGETVLIEEADIYSYIYTIWQVDKVK